MQAINIDNLAFSNKGGINKEMCARHHFTGNARNFDNKPYYSGSDIEQLHMSVKSDHFTLASSTTMTATTFMGQLDEYFERTASTCVCYVTNDYTAYIMSMAEFREFLMAFGVFEKDSSTTCRTHAIGYKVRCKHESGKMRAWLAERA